MKKNNKILLIVFFGLVVVFVATKMLRTPARESNLDIASFAIDTALIHTVKFKRPGAEIITLQKEGQSWKVNEGDKEANAAAQTVKSFMNNLKRAKPERIVTRNEDKWSMYQVDDSTAIHFTALDVDNEPLINWRVGKMSSGLTYVRPEEETEVYAMEGNFRSNMDDAFNDWRDKTFLKVEPSAMKKITFTYPSDSGFVLSRNGNKWVVNNQPADSAQVEKYLQKWQSRTLRQFADTAPDRNADITISAETDNGPVEVKAWKDNEDKWIVSSTIQEGVYFKDARIDEELFVGSKGLQGTK